MSETVQTLRRTLRRHSADVLRRLHLLEPARRVRTGGCSRCGTRSSSRTFRSSGQVAAPAAEASRADRRYHPHHDDDHLWGGQACADLLAKSLQHDVPSIRDLEPIFDFGCGCGRVMRHLWAAEPGLRVWGCDINAAQIAWCRANLPFEVVEASGPTPPLRFGDGTFGLAYAFSVFTHLPAELQQAWLQELIRVVRPGGYICLSFHGAAFASRFLRADERAQFAAGKLVVHRPEDANDPESYARCGAYHPPAYVTGELTRGLTVVAHIPGVLGNAWRRTIGQDTREDITVVMSPKRKMSAVIRRLRARQRMTQEELAKKARVTQGYISQLEAGAKKEIGAKVAVRLAAALGVPVTELLG